MLKVSAAARQFAQPPIFTLPLIVFEHYFFNQNEMDIK